MNGVEPLLVHTLNITSQLHHHFNDTVNNFIHNNEWRITTNLQQIFPTLLQHVNTVIIPSSPQPDELIWNPTIPPSKSFLIWRAIQKNYQLTRMLKGRKTQEGGLNCVFKLSFSLSNSEHE